MREELSHRGFIETRTPEQVDELLTTAHGTVLMVINSVCGCAAGSARPGVIQSLEGDIKPDKIATVFAGGDIEAVAHLRKILSDYPPSSPSVVPADFKLTAIILTPSSYLPMEKGSDCP